MPILDSPVILFGGYVESATLNAEYGSQSTTCQISLIYDGDGPLTKTDYTKNFPALGTCVGFKFGDLEFVGIFQRWSEKKDIGGYKYDIILESASKILDGVNVILSDFQGSAYPRLGVFVNQISNVWNIFAELENYAFGGIFGGANTNSAGFIGLLALDMMERMSRGELQFGGPIVYGQSTFSLDLSELKQTLGSLVNAGVYRIEGQSKSISAIIDEACSLLMYDYLVEILPVDGIVINGAINNAKISIKMIDKSKPPDLSVIRNAIKRYEQNGELVSSDFGQELTNTVTQKLVLGGLATRYKFIERDGFIQLWGKTKGPRPQYTTKIILDNGVAYPFGPDELTPDIMEVRAAVHSFDSWVLWHIVRRQLLAQTQDPAYANPIIDAYASSLFTSVAINSFVIDRIATGKITASDLIDTSLEANKKRNYVTTGGYVYEELQKIHNNIKSAGEEYWGKKYAVILPIEPGGKANNLKFTTEDFQYINTWEMADSAWHEYPTPFGDVSFYDGDGKLKTTATWVYNPDVADYTNLGNGYCFGTKGGISAVVNVEKDIYWNRYGGTGPSFATCVVDLPAVAVFDRVTTEHNALFHFLQMYFGYTNEQLKGIFFLGAEAGSTIYGIAPDRAPPVNIGIAQISTRFRWGPWWNYKSLNGASEVIVEDSLTPETFGGIDVMSQYGSSYAYVANAEVTGVESGSLELAGAPIGNIGRKFLVSGPYITGLSVNIGVGGVTTTYKFNTWTPQFGKLAKFNADRLAKLNKNLFRFFQDKRGQFQNREFLPQQYKDKIFKNNRPLFMNQAGAPFVTQQRTKVGPPGNKKLRTTGNQGVVANQGVPLLNNPTEVHGCSLEQINSPVYIAKTPKEADVGEKPCFQKPVDNYTKFSSAPTSENLNPYFTHEETDFSFTISNDGKSPDMNMQKLDKKPDSVQTVGLRGPLMLSGWGLSNDLKKVPFVEGDTQNYIEDVGTDRNSWKTGPLDARWDEERKVWGSGFDFAEGFLKTDMTVAKGKTEPTTFTVSVYRNQDLTIEKDGLNKDVKLIKWQQSIKETNPEEITGINRSTKLSAITGAYVVLMRINYEWRPIYVDCT